MTDWDDAYANAAHIPDSGRWPDAWSRPAHEYRNAMIAEGRARVDLPFGDDERQRFDLFLPFEQPRGLLVFVHGGYWLAFDKNHWSHLAQGAVARGYAVAIPSYRLCPEVRIGTIAQDIAHAIDAAGALVDGPIMLAGHSAGGQLVARMATTTTPLSPALQQRLRRVTAISGLHDVRPLMLTTMSSTLQIDPGEAKSESPALLMPLPHVRVNAWVGADERPEFVRQSILLGNAWPDVVVTQAPSCHHFNVLDPLCEPHSALTETILGIE
jgi:arylformamidase